MRANTGLAWYLVEYALFVPDVIVAVIAFCRGSQKRYLVLSVGVTGLMNVICVKNYGLLHPLCFT